MLFQTIELKVASWLSATVLFDKPFAETIEETTPAEKREIDRAVKTKSIFFFT